MKIYVGNLSFDTDEGGLRAAFSEFGEVQEVAVITDRDTGRSRGFGFITMGDDDTGQKAIDSLNGQQLDGRALVVNVAKPRSTAGGGGGGGGGRDRW